MNLLIHLHSRGVHKDRPHPLCSACRYEDPTVEASWVARAKARTLPPRITDGVSLR